MKTILLGNTNIEISPVGLGCMGFSHAYGAPMEKEEAIRKIRAAYDMGYTFFDTAQRYTGINSDGTTSYNEELVGEALKDVRDKVVIATKCGISMIENQRILDARPETIKRTLDESLKRLQTDYVDLYYLHSIDPNIPIEIVAQTMKELFESGKIRAWGIPQVDADTVRRAHKIFPVSAIQGRYSMMARENEDLFDVCKELSITFVAFSPMANGFLTGADEKNATMGQISLAWMENKDVDIVPIPGSTKLERLEENFNSCKIILTSQEVKEIDKALSTMKMGPVFQGSQKRATKE